MTPPQGAAPARALRILHTSPSVHPRAGGLGTDTLGMAIAHRELGHAVRIWTQDSAHVLRDAQRTCGFDAGLVERFAAVPGLGYSPAMERAARGAAAREFMVVHQHGIWPMLSRATTAWRRAHRGPVVVGPQGSFNAAALARSAWKKRFALATYEGTNLREASALIANNPAEMDALREHGLVNPIAVIPNAIPVSWLDARGDATRFRARHGLDASRPMALFLSRLHPIKGLPMLLRAIARHPRELGEWQFVIAGPDESGHEAEVRRLAGELQISRQVHFLGPLWEDEKRDAFAASDLFVLPSHSESFGIAVAEALGAGVPVLVTRGAPWASVVSTGSGWWVDATDDGIAAGLLDATGAGVDVRAAMGARGRRLIEERFTWPKVAGEVILLYEWLLAGGHPPASVSLA